MKDEEETRLAVEKWCAFNRLSFDVDWVAKAILHPEDLDGNWWSTLCLVWKANVKQQNEANRHAALVVGSFLMSFLIPLLQQGLGGARNSVMENPLTLYPWESLRQASKNPDGCQAAHETNEMDTPQDPCICLVIKTKHVFAILLLFFRRYLYQCLWNVYTCIDMHRLFVYTVQRLSCKHDVHQGYPRCGGFNMSVVEKRVGDWRHPEPSNPQYKNTQEFQWSMFLCETM